VWHIGFRIRVEGRENLKKVQTKGYILAPTHVSAIDPVFIVVTRWGRRMVVFAKKELFEINALLTWFFRCCGGVCVRGTKDEMAVISQTVEACKQGKTLLIFPEGTREKEGKLLPPKSGLFVIAAEAGVDVVQAPTDGFFADAAPLARLLANREFPSLDQARQALDQAILALDPCLPYTLELQDA
jgi:1-acyl-sn-glycerol-3-phosphate acyltransferase